MDERQALIRQMESRASALEREARALEAEAAQFRAAVAALKGELVAPSHSALPGDPSRAKRIRRTGPASTMSVARRVMAEAKYPLEPSIMAERMLAQGWETTSSDPVNTLRTALARMFERGEVMRFADGTFALNLAWKGDVDADEED